MDTACKNPKSNRYVMCVRNEDCDDLQLRKVYQLLPDPKAQLRGMMRIIDDSGEDYLYPVTYFVPVSISAKAMAQVPLCDSPRSVVRGVDRD